MHSFFKVQIFGEAILLLPNTSIVQRLELFFCEDSVSKMLSSIHEGLFAWVSRAIYTPRPFTKGEGLLSQQDKKTSVFWGSANKVLKNANV